MNTKNLEKQAVIYTRVSTDEQAEKGYSLDAQLDAILKYAKAKGLIIANTFKEDYSAKLGFNRPAYKELREYLNQNKNVNEILVTQWSRFSREATESLIELKYLKSKGITVTAIEQLTDETIPENLILKAFHLFIPQVENERLSLRTKAGMRQALKTGKWLWKAPFGYINNKLDKTIEVDCKAAEIVKFAFSEFAKGIFTAEEVRRMVDDKGYKIKKQSFLNMLKNIFYNGKILIPAIKDETTNIIDGLHAKLIDDETFAIVQSILSGKRKPYKGKTTKEEIPLVGLLTCPLCNKKMTGSGSTGNGGLYHYYHCQRKYGCNNKYKASLANAKFEAYLDNYKPNKEVLDLYFYILQDVFNTNETEREEKRKQLNKQLNETVGRQTKVEDDYMNERIAAEFSQKILKQLEGKKNEIIIQLATLNSSVTEFNKYLNYSFSLLQDLGGYYKAASIHTKQKIVGSIFPENLVFDGKDYRTTKTNEVFALICNAGKGFKQNSPANSARLSTFAPQSGLEPETL